jgi:hypothetical protein
MSTCHGFSNKFLAIFKVTSRVFEDFLRGSYIGTETRFVIVLHEPEKRNWVGLALAEQEQSERFNVLYLADLPFARF